MSTSNLYGFDEYDMSKNRDGGRTQSDKADDVPDCPGMKDNKCHLNKCGMFVPTGKDEGACFAHILGVYFANKLKEGMKDEGGS